MDREGRDTEIRADRAKACGASEEEERRGTCELRLAYRPGPCDTHYTLECSECRGRTYPTARYWPVYGYCPLCGRRNVVSLRLEGR